MHRAIIQEELNHGNVYKNCFNALLEVLKKDFGENEMLAEGNDILNLLFINHFLINKRHFKILIINKTLRRKSSRLCKNLTNYGLSIICCISVRLSCHLSHRFCLPIQKQAIHSLLLIITVSGRKKTFSR